MYDKMAFTYCYKSDKIMTRYYVICEKDGYIVKDYYMVDSAIEAFEEFEKEYGAEGYELTMLFKCE